MKLAVTFFEANVPLFEIPLRRIQSAEKVTKESLPETHDVLCPHFFLKRSGQENFRNCNASVVHSRNIVKV